MSTEPETHTEDREYWQRLDNLFHRTIGHAERAFKINVYINLIIVGVGIALLVYSMIYSWLNNLDIYSTAFGGLGVVSFIAVFYFTPQKKIQKTVGDLTQIQMFYRTYFMLADAVYAWDYHSRKKSLQELKEMNKHLEELTCNITKKIEEFIGKKE